MKEVLISEIDDVEIPTETPVSKMIDEQVIKMHFEAWHRQDVVDVFGFKNERVSSSELESRGWEAYPEDKLYVKE